MTGLTNISNNGEMIGNGPNGGQGPMSYLTLSQGHVTLNPYHYQNYGEDLHDGLAATLHLRDTVYMSPQLVKLTNTLRTKKKVCQGSHPDQDQTCPDQSEVVFRAVSPHGHVYWEIEPKNMGQHPHIVESSPVPQNLRHIPNPTGVFDALATSNNGKLYDF